MNAFEIVALAREIMAGKRNKKMTAAVIEAALADLRAEREHAHTSAAELVERRRTALLDGLDDGEIEAIEAQERALDRKLERLDLAEPELRKRLDEARSEARRELFKRNAQYLKESRARYLDLARQAAKAAGDFVDLRYKISNDFPEVLLLSQIPIVGDSFVIHDTVIAAWEADTERFFDALPVIDQTQGRPWDGADEPGRTLDYSGFNTPAPMIVQQTVKKQAPAPARTTPRDTAFPKQSAGVPMPDDGTFQTIAVATRNEAPAMDRGTFARLLAEAEMKTGEDALLTVNFFRRFDAGDERIEPGEHRVTPEIARAAVLAGKADLVNRAAVPAGGDA